MKEKLRNLWINLLFWLLGEDFGESIEEDDKDITRWLANSSQDMGFIKYCQSRERRLIRALLLDGLAPMPRDSFVRKSGQRFELHAFLTHAKKARQFLMRRQKEKEERIES